MVKVTAPIINLNGTSADELMNQNIEAAEALRAAILALQKAAPHGRDYQTAMNDEYKQARAEHQARLVILNSVLDQIVSIGSDIHGQRDAAIRRKK